MFTRRAIFTALLVLVCFSLLVVVFDLTSGQGIAAGSFIDYLPLVRKDVAPTPIPSPTPTVAPTATPIPPTPIPADPLPAGSSVCVLTLDDTPLSVVVTDSAFYSILYPDYGDPVTALGKYLVVWANVTNQGLQSDYLSRFELKVVDEYGRQFDMAELEVQWAAQDQFDREGVYEDIQPGFTLPLVFVYDVHPTSQRFSLRSVYPCN